MYTLNLQSNEKMRFLIRQIGCGGTGSYFFRTLTQLISGHLVSEPRISYDLGIADGDKVESKNLRNQLFTQEDISYYKTECLIERYGLHYELDVKDWSNYVTTIKDIQELFHCEQTEIQTIPILIGMVDNNRTRQLFHEVFTSQSVKDLIWIDLGNEDIETIENPTPEEKRRLRSVGFGGQCVVGLKWNRQIVLPCVTQVYPNLLEIEETFPGLNCGDTLPSNPQRMITNQTAAHVAAMIINTLIFTKSIYVSEINFNAQLGHTQPSYITKDQYTRFIEACKRKGAV